MKIGEAKQAYREQLQIQRNQKQELLKKQEEYRKKIEHGQTGGAGCAAGGSSNGVTLELSGEYKMLSELQGQIDSLSDEIKKNEKGLEGIIEAEMGIINSEAAKQQGDAMKKYAEDMAKCLEIARRISHGDKVPATDEQKLMEFNMEIYMAAKNMAVMNMDKEQKEWDSMWADEEEKKKYDNPIETAANTEINAAMPEGMSAPVEGAEG